MKNLFIVFLFISISSFAQTIDNKPRVFNVKMFGASGDSTQDATPFIQAAINACFTSGGGTVYFPNGFYTLSSALVTSENSVNPNSQLYIPPVDFLTGGTQKTHISFIGESKPYFSPAALYADVKYPRTGVIIKSTITGSGITPAIFGGVGASGGFTVEYVSFENLAILVKANAGATGPTMSGINGRDISSIMVNNCVVGIDTSLYRDTLPQNQVAGIMTTKKTGECLSSIRNTLVYGFRYGIVAGEHCYLENTLAWNNYSGYLIPANVLPVYGTKIEAEWNLYDLTVPNTDVMGYSAGSCNFNIGLFEVETYNFNTRWFNNVKTIADSGNRCIGLFHYNLSNSPGSTGVTAFGQYNGTTVNAIPLSNPGLLPYYLALSPTRAAGTSLQLSKGNSSTPYKNLGANDGAIANYSTGNLSLLNDNGGNINLNAGTAAAQVTLTSTSLTSTAPLVVNTGILPATFNNSSGSGNAQVVVNTGSNTNAAVTFQNNAAPVWYTGNIGTAGANYFRMTNSDANGNSERFKLTQAGILTLNAYGAGIATFDASGNISSSAGGGFTFSTGLTNTALTITNNLSTGISGGQSVVGGTAASEALTLSSTAHATKGKILFGTSAYDEVNNRLGIVTASPSTSLHVNGAGATINTLGNVGILAQNAGATRLMLYNSNSSGSRNLSFEMNSDISKFAFGVDYNANGGNNFWLYDRVASQPRIFIESNGNIGINNNAAPTAKIHISAGTATASTAPLKFTSGALLTTPEAGGVEFLTDGYYVTTTTGAKRRFVVAGTSGRSTAQTAAVASLATYTLGASDASYEVSANVLITTSSAEAFTVTCAYTDEGNTARTLTMPFVLLAGTTAAAINFANGAVPYEGIPVHIRCKASTAITIATTGTFTGATYNAEGVIKQIQ